MNDRIPNPVSDADGEQWKHSQAGLRARAAAGARLGGSTRRGAFRWLAPGLAVALIAATIVWLRTEPISPAAGGCPVTGPAADRFTPPEGIASEPWIAGEQWYGSPDLWTIIAAGGGYTPRMTAFWSVAFPGDDEETPPLDVTARRLDGPGTVESRGTARAFSQGAGWFMKADLAVLPPGCWEVTGTYRGATLSFVVEVARSDDTCPATTTEGTGFAPPPPHPATPPDLYQSHWYGTEDLWIMLPFEGATIYGPSEKLFFWSRHYSHGLDDYTPNPGLTVTLTPLDVAADPVVITEATNGRRDDLGSFMIAGTALLPDGCWMVTAEYRGATLTYVARVTGS